MSDPFLKCIYIDYINMMCPNMSLDDRDRWNMAAEACKHIIKNTPYKIVVLKRRNEKLKYE